MEKINKLYKLTQEQWDEFFKRITAANVVGEADASHQVIRDHQQPLVMFEEVRNAILLV